MEECEDKKQTPCEAEKKTKMQHDSSTKRTNNGQIFYCLIIRKSNAPVYMYIQ